MSRYLLFLVLSSILAFFILVSSHHGTLYLNICGLLLLSLGTSKFLSSPKTAGVLSALGLATILHVVFAWWRDLIEYESGYPYTKQSLLIFLFFTLVVAALLSISILSIFSEKDFNTSFDKKHRSRTLLHYLAALPPLLLLAEIIICLLVIMKKF